MPTRVYRVYRSGELIAEKYSSYGLHVYRGCKIVEECLITHKTRSYWIN